MFIYQTFATELLEPKEAQRLFRSMAIVIENMVRDFFESTAQKAGFHIMNRDSIDSEWRENSIEEGDAGLLQDLLRIARMRRQEEALVREYGRKCYEAAYGEGLWGIYQMLGKLCPTVYILKKPEL